MNRNIGISLSGGGIRATVFHLGVLRSLAEKNRLKDVSFISTVSGGSLCVGLIYSLAGNRWPSDTEYLDIVLPKAKDLITRCDTQSTFTRRSFFPPWRIISGRANILGQILEEIWGIKGTVAEMPTTPRWIINATCYETGKNWRFMAKRMGDYMANYVLEPDFKLSHAIAASAAVPGLIGSLKVRTRDYTWVRYRNNSETETVDAEFDTLHLWDGGVYENLGLEPLFKGHSLTRKEFDYLIVSDASAALPKERGSFYFSVKSALRLVDIATNQIRSLRSRSVIQYFANNPKTGILLRIGNTCQYIVESVSVQGFDLDKRLNRADVNKIASMATTLRKLTDDEFDLIERHGWEVCEATTYSYGGP